MLVGYHSNWTVPLNLRPPSLIVLGLLEIGGAATPYELKRAAAERIGDFWSLAHSQLYAEPERLAGLGLVEVDREQDGRRRKRYAITPKGRKVLSAWLDQSDETTYDLRDPGLLKLALGADPRSLAPRQVELHQRALARYEEIWEALPPAARGSGRVLALEAGMGHEREYVRFWSALAGDQSD